MDRRVNLVVTLIRERSKPLEPCGIGYRIYSSVRKTIKAGECTTIDTGLIFECPNCIRWYVFQHPFLVDDRIAPTGLTYVMRGTLRVTQEILIM